MTCGCAYAPSPTTQTTERALVCAACPERIGFTSCTLSRKTLAQIITKDECPLGRFPDAQGRTEWIGVSWIGVPAPIRWAASTWLGRKILGLPFRPANVPGCGCIAAWKRWWTRAASGSPTKPVP